MITGISQVILPVDDPERAKAFWTAVVGFELRTDARYGATERWIEVVPPDSAPRLVLSRRRDDALSHGTGDDLPDAPVFFTCDDVEGTYRELTERGVRFPTPPQRLEFGWWSVFEDHEGTRYALG